jgi:hypothetical protein
MLTPELTSGRRRRLSPRTGYALAAVIVGLALFAAGVPSPLYETVLFILASSLAWLFVARALQGLATGALLSAAGAALFDLHPRRDPVGVSLANGVASAAGLGLGVLVSAALVELLPAPRVLPYVALLALFAVAFAGVWRMPEPVAARTRPRLTPQRPTSASGAVAQLALGRTPPWAGAAGGSLVLSAGMVLLVIATAADSSVVYLAGAVIGGGGFGIAFLGALRALSAVIPNEHRAAVLSAFYVVAYAALSLPAIAGGLVVGSLGLLATFQVFGSVVAALALVVAVLAWRTRPRTERPRHRLAYVLATHH